jgi:hypothetical protein
MKPKIERASAITRDILTRKEALIRSYNDAGDGPQSIFLKLSNGATINFQAKAIADVLSPLAAADAANDNGWTYLHIKIDSQVKFRIRYRGTEVVMLEYFPGNWERRFGVDPGGDLDVLLPLALRGDDASHQPRTGYVSHDKPTGPNQQQPGNDS